MRDSHGKALCVEFAKGVLDAVEPAGCASSVAARGAPISTVAVPSLSPSRGRGVPSRSKLGAPELVPASIAGEPGISRKFPAAAPQLSRDVDALARRLGCRDRVLARSTAFHSSQPKMAAIRIGTNSIRV